MDLVQYFKEENNLGTGIRQFFTEGLNLKLLTPTEKTLSKPQVFSGISDEKISDIDYVYFAGKLSDKTFWGEGDKASYEETEKELALGKYASILVFGIELNVPAPSRSRLAEITRWLNRKSLGVPVAVVFRYNGKISFANAERTPYFHKNKEGEKAGKIVMLKDVAVENTHAAHCRILLGDSRGYNGLKVDHVKINSFEKLYQYWQTVFALQSLNDQFYSDLQDWFYYALVHVKLPFCPTYIDSKENVKNFLVRLLARTLFCWFVKEKGLIRKELLELVDWEGNRFELTNDTSAPEFLKSNSYYRGILQNVFFNALNQAEKKSTKDFKWIKYLHPNFDINWFTNIPYLNGGIFDKLEEDNAKESIEDTVIKIPNFLFYGIDTTEKVTIGKGAKARIESQNVVHKGLNGILNSYKFTLDENTPFEEDIALDPEMLGLVFENLLAELDPNLEEGTKSSIRKLTGSFYTPRKVILEMVNDSLFLYLSKYLVDNCPEVSEPKKAVSNLIYNHQTDKTNLDFCDAIVQALDKYKMLDPACGSGAFPMGMLHRIVDLLKLVDEDNERWLELKLVSVDVAQKSEFKKVLTKHLNDYSRKLGIIRDSIYGIDIQPLAVQITKLRFFISLLIDQKIEKGITPMPNIETKIICANSLKNIKVDFFSAASIEKLLIARAKYYQPDISHNERDQITEEIVDVLDKAFPFFAKQVTGKIIPGQNKILLKEWFTHGGLAAPFFNMEFFYPELKNDGFDCVIGNPPYGGVKIDDEVRSALKIESKDPYGAFIARFLQEGSIQTPLKPGGVLSFIVSDTFMTIKSHLPLRRHLMDNYVHKMIRVHPDTFRATVNTVILLAERNQFKIEQKHGATFTKKDQFNEEHICLMADMTNISIHENYEHFVEVLAQTRGADFEGSDAQKQDSNEVYGIYYYPQSLIKTNSNLPFFVASPKLFGLMNDIGNDLIKEFQELGGKQMQVRKVFMNGNEIQVVKLGDVAENVGGVKTYDNVRFIKTSKSTGSYETISDNEIAFSLTEIEKKEGIKNSRLDKYVAFDKSGDMISDDGSLINYFKPIEYYLDWSQNAVEFYSSNNGLRNKHRYFQDGITYSVTGVYAPTFRIGTGFIFGQKGATIFTDNFSKEYLLSFLCSKLNRFLVKNYLSHGVDSTDSIIAEIILIPNSKELLIAEEMTNKILKQLSNDPSYKYEGREQIEIDKLVYKAYGLNEEDVMEVGNWYARRYPKLSAAQKANLRKLGKSDDYLELYGMK